MKTEQERLVHLRLRQAQRREIPWSLLKIIFVVSVVFFLTVLAASCSVPPLEKPLSREQKQENREQLYGKQKEAHKARLP